MKSPLTQRVCLHGYSPIEIPAIPAALPDWPEIKIVLCRPHEYEQGELIERRDSWNVIHTLSGLKVNAGCVSKTRKRAIEDANDALNAIAKTRGRDAVLRFVELETKRSLAPKVMISL